VREIGGGFASAKASNSSKSAVLVIKGHSL
jgi:hypothetical protein